MSQECKGFTKTVNRNTEKDEVFIGEGNKKERKKMKLFSKGRTALFIPGLRKNKKIIRNNEGLKNAPVLVRNEVVDDGDKNSTNISLNTACDPTGNNPNIDGMCVHNVSECATEPLADRRTTSVDSGIDCLHPSVLCSDSGPVNMNDSITLPVGPTIKKPDRSLSFVIKSSDNESMCYLDNSQQIDEQLINNLPTITENPCDHQEEQNGRAPIASPEDDSLLQCPDTDSDNSDTDGESIKLSPGKYALKQKIADSDSESDLLSPMRPRVKFKKKSVQNSSDYRQFVDYSSCDSDSDSDSERKSRNRRHDLSDSYSSDSEDSEGSMFLTQEKCYSQSVPSGSVSDNSISKSRLASNSNSVNKESVNKKCTVKPSRVKRGNRNGRKETTFCVTPDKSKTVVLDSPHQLVNPQPTYAKGDRNYLSSSFSQRRSSPLLKVNNKSAFSSFRSTGSLPRRISYVDSVQSGWDSKLDSVKSKKDMVSVPSKVKLKRSLSDAASRFKFPKFGLSQKRDLENSIHKNEKHDLETSLSRKNKLDTALKSSSKHNQSWSSLSFNTSFSSSSSLKNSLNNSMPVSSRNTSSSFLSSADSTNQYISAPKNTKSSASSSGRNSGQALNLDTSKSPQDVQRAMKKTAFWVENNCYDHTLDPSSTNSLLKEKKPVSETDLCNEILGIYFGDDSDSSLSSSCLDNTGDSSSSLSYIGDEYMDQCDDAGFSVATFVPPPCHTSEAKTRRIRNDVSQHIASKTISSQLKEEKMKLQQLREHKAKLQEKIKNVETRKSKHKSVSEKKRRVTQTCDMKPPSLLSEHEVDTITKLHTINNGQRKVKYLNLSESPMIIKHFPPPKNASRISWCDKLTDSELVHHTPVNTPIKVKPILYERPTSHIFPFDEDKPSPIVITKIRRSKSTSRRKEWPW